MDALFVYDTGADRRFDIAAIRRCRGILNRIAEIAWMGQHARKQWVDVLGEIGSALTETADRERDQKRRRTGDVHDQARSCPPYASCHENVDPQAYGRRG